MCVSKCGGKKHEKRKGLTNEDRREYETLIEAFFESIGPRVKTSTPSNTDELILVERPRIIDRGWQYLEGMKAILRLK